ncbi:hypothetical protein BUALT_Bualt12G0107400 [Buddleja alternifolia]|uniref:F-box domain-containing protein n=1 Tax=Buddleja alternifolia TaxID=168488 RepID=A0AAV6WXI0_9LAMI|nr:hypothetical protein BUALT_Bualt12G0107400 [Buddleja alternifolia]
MTRDWADLREELLEVILSNLSAKDRFTFGLVCRSWNSVATSVAKSSVCGHSPCMFYHRSNCLWKFVKYKDFSYMDFPQLYNAKICCSKYGWLLMSRDDGSLFFFDPFKEQRIRELPKHKYPYATICFFNEPTSTNCIVVGISNMLNTHKVIMGVLKHRKDEWKVNIYNRTRSEFQLSICTPILHCGKLYSLDVKGNVATFDMNGHDNGPSWYVYDSCLFPSWIHHKIEQQFLIKLEEEEVLFAVFVAHDVRKVSVYRSKLRKENCMVQWVLVKDLGDKAFFVSHTASFAVTACSESMANKIYFTKFHGNSGVYFSLKTQKYHSFNGDFSSLKCYGLKELDFATWILPTISWRMLTKE